MAGRILWEGVADTCRCRIIEAHSCVFVQWLYQDGTPAVWPQPADGKPRSDNTVEEEAYRRAVSDLARELAALRQP